MNPRFILLLSLFLGGCAGSKPPLLVKQFQLRDQESTISEEPLIRMEKDRHLHGAISLAERNKLLGEYYTLTWNTPPNSGKGPITLLFQYQQDASASRIKRMIKTFSASPAHGKTEFSITGDNYTKGGKALSWKATLLRADRELASRQSYLWQ